MSDFLIITPGLIVTWHEGRPVTDNFITKNCSDISKDTLLLLSRCASPITREDLLQELRKDGFDIDRAELSAAVDTLITAGLLEVTAAGEDDGNPIDRCRTWSYWGTEAKYFHFATKDAPYVVDSDIESVEYFEDIANGPQPPLTKRYSQAVRIPLPRVGRDLTARFTQVLADRRTVRAFKDAPVELDRLSRLCELTFAPQRFVDAGPFGALPLRAYANAGARSELEVYINAINVAGLDQGLYHYNGLEHSLELLRDAVPAEGIVHLSYNQDMCTAAPVSFFVTACVDRMGHKYRHPRALRAIYTDAGHMAQTFAMVATACGLGAWQTLAFRDSEIEEIIAVDGIAETAIYFLGAGISDTQADASSPETSITIESAKRTVFYEMQTDLGVMMNVGNREFHSQYTQGNIPILEGKRIAVIYGGVSEEDRTYIQEVPVAQWSLTAIMKVLGDAGLQARHLDPTNHHFIDQLTTFDAAFINVHGPYGEDGRLQGLLDYLGIPYTGSGVLAGSVGMDKLISKAIFRELGIATPRSSGLIISEFPSDFPMPAVVKTVDGGSSIGIKLVQNTTQAVSACAELAETGFRRLFLEEFIKGRPLTVGVIGSPSGPDSLPPLEFITEATFYDAETKLGGEHAPAVHYCVPDDLSAELMHELDAASKAIYDFLDCRGAIRVDYVIDPAGVAYALEINTLPGLQPHSNLPVACEHVGISYRALILHLLAEAIRVHQPIPWAAHASDHVTQTDNGE